MSSKFKWLLIALTLIINLQIYAYKYASGLTITKSPLTIDKEGESDNKKNEILYKKRNFTDNDRDGKFNYTLIIPTTQPPIDLSSPTVESDRYPYGHGGESELDSSECILARSEFYLSWWVHENGSLRVQPPERLDGSGFMDLSLNFSSEDSIYTHVLSFTTNNPKEVKMQFLSYLEIFLNTSVNIFFRFTNNQ